MRKKEAAFAVAIVTCFAACSERAANKGAPTSSSPDAAQVPSDAESPSSDAQSAPDAHTPEAGTPFAPGLQYLGSLALEKVQ